MVEVSRAKFVWLLVGLMLFVGCESAPPLSESEQFAIDFYQKVMVEYDQEAVEAMVKNQALLNRVKNHIQAMQAKDQKTEKVILVADSRAAMLETIRRYMLLRSEYQDMVTVTLEKLDGVWKVTDFTYHTAVNVRDFPLEAQKIIEI